MKVTRDVVRDLLPLYAAGEASADSRALVEEFLQQDPELAQLAEVSRSQESALRSGAEIVSTVDSERASLRLAQRLIARRTLLLGAGIFFALLPGTFLFSDNTVVWLMWRDFRPGAVLSLLLAVSAWVGFFWTTRRLRVTGL